MTLIETMVVMTGVAVMLGLCAVTIQLLMRLEIDARNRLTATASIDRLAGLLRRDVHAATKAEMVAGAKKEAPETLSLTGSEARLVSYEPRGHELIRVETVGGKRVSRDAFMLGAGLMPRFGIREEDAGRFVVLRVEPARLEGEERSQRALEVVALVGRDRRGLAKFSGGAPTKKGAGE